MYFLIDNKKQVVARCKNENEIGCCVMNYFNSILKVPAIQTISWDIVLKDGYFYFKDTEGNYELREYKISEGWVYNGLHYDVLGKYTVSKFETSQPSKLKPSYVDAVNSTVLVEKPPCPLTPRLPLIDEK
jgi:hypothetical protein